MTKYYTPDMVSTGQHGICVKCKKGPTKEGHDGCLGTLPGNIMNACCGHGNDRQAYIQYGDNKTGRWVESGHIKGDEAIAEQLRLINGL